MAEQPCNRARTALAPDRLDALGLLFLPWVRRHRWRSPPVEVLRVSALADH
jgi:hypothetical protein